MQPSFSQDVRFHYSVLQLGCSHRCNQACNHTIATNNKWKCILWSICMSWKQNNIGTRWHISSMTTLLKASWGLSSLHLRTVEICMHLLSQWTLAHRSFFSSGTAGKLVRGVHLCSENYSCTASLIFLFRKSELSNEALYAKKAKLITLSSAAELNPNI